MSYIVIPIFSDPHLHPLHKNNGLSLLYVKGSDGESQMICQFHPDCTGVLEDYKWLEDKLIFTPDVKVLEHIHPFKNVIDMNWLWWSKTNQPFDIESIRNNAYDFFHNKYYTAKRLNEIIPIVKHKEWCKDLETKIGKIIDIEDDIQYSQYSREATKAFGYIESTGVKVSDDVCDIFDMRVKKHISNGRLYTKYNLWTSTGRPSNSFGNVNFAAMKPAQRKAIIPEYDMLVEYDYDAYHLRLIGDLIGYKFDKDSVHQHLAEKYGSTYEESKQISFKLLYGGIDKKTREDITFFGLTYDKINTFWEYFKSHKFIETDIYNRKLLSKNYTDMNKNKLFNYLIQAYETESNIKTIIELKHYLLDKKTKLVLYGYDSFLFDFSKQDGVSTLTEIKNILERNGHMVKSQAGSNYGEMNDISDRL
jgi:hypothetical protein